MGHDIEVEEDESYDGEGVILGIDPGFRHSGGVEFNPNTNKVEAYWAVHSPNKNNEELSVSRGDFMDALAMVRGIKLRVCDASGCLVERIKSVVVELPHGGAKSSRAARSMGIITGILAGLADTWNKPFFTYRPAEVKKYMTGKGNASKNKVEEAVIESVGEDWMPSKKKDREHIVDATAAVLAALKDCDSNLL